MVSNKLAQNPSESKIQGECFAWLWNYHPETRRCFFAIPNGGRRNPREAMTLKATGLIAGVPDTCLVWKGRIYFFEFKTEKGLLSESQIKFIPSLEKQGAIVYICKSFEDFKDIIGMIL